MQINGKDVGAGEVKDTDEGPGESRLDGSSSSMDSPIFCERVTRRIENVKGQSQCNYTLYFSVATVEKNRQQLVEYHQQSPTPAAGRGISSSHQHQ